MDTLNDIMLAALIFAAAILYASVGHAGASGYLAAMAIFGLTPEVMRPSALVLNVLVASIATIKYYRAGHFSWPLFWPLIIVSAPMAYLGGVLTMPSPYYKILVGIILIFAAWQMLRLAKVGAEPHYQTPPRYYLLSAGAGIGFLSGLTGVGGGIFLSPLLVLMRWAEFRQVAAVAAPFILINSVAGLLGVFSVSMTLPPALPWWCLAAIIGGLIGAELGSKKTPVPKLRVALAVVLVIAGIKMIVIN